MGTMVRLRGSARARFLMPKLRLLLPVMVFVAALAFGAGSAAAKSSGHHKPACWKTLLNDEWDGRIDGTYPVSCYRQALKHLPEDVLIYGQAKDDLNRALLGAVLANGGKPPPPDRMIPGSPGRKLQGSKKDEGWLDRLAGKLGPGNATSIPCRLCIRAPSTRNEPRSSRRRSGTAIVRVRDRNWPVTESRVRSTASAGPSATT